MKLTARDEIQAFGKTKEVTEPPKKKKPRVTKAMPAGASLSGNLNTRRPGRIANCQLSTSGTRLASAVQAVGM